MRIVILSRQESLYSTRMLAEAGRRRGHDVDVLDTLQFDIRLSRRNPELLYQGQPVGPVDAVIPRIGASITFFGLAVVRQFEMMGVYCLNESQAIARSRDKLRCLQLLSRHDIGMPPTVYTRQADHVAGCIEQRRGAAGRGQAAPGHAGHRRRAGRERAGGRVGHRGLPRPGTEHPDPEVHQGGQGRRHPRPGGRPQGGGGDEAQGGGRRVPLQPAPRRQGQESPPAPRISPHRAGGGARAGAARGRRRSDRVGRGADGDGGQLVAGPGRAFRRPPAWTWPTAIIEQIERELQHQPGPEADGAKQAS